MSNDSNFKRTAATDAAGYCGVLLSRLRGKCARSLAFLLAMIMSHAFILAADKVGVKELSQTTLFAFGGIGIAGIVSPGEVAFRNVLDSGSAVADFREILKTGSPQGQCYALVGLRIKDRPAFDEEVKRFLSSKQQVQTGAGCILSAQPMSSVAGNIRNGNYDAQAKEKPRVR